MFYWVFGRAVRTLIVVPPLKIDNFEEYNKNKTSNSTKKKLFTAAGA